MRKRGGGSDETVTTSRVLLVEDNPITRKVVRSALEAHSLGVQEACTGRAALNLWHRAPSNLVLQDLVLSDMNGFELCERLRAAPAGADVPVIAFSGLLSELEQARISSVGFNDVITKPIEPMRLLNVVRAHLPDNTPPVEGFGRGRTVVVVDDDPVQNKLLCFRLQRQGFRTLPARHGAEALEIVQRTPPDAVVSDVMMPALDGFGLCFAIRKDPRLAQLPLVLMTNTYIDTADRDLARNAGAHQFVIRTPSMREVVEALRMALTEAPLPQGTPSAAHSSLEVTWSQRVAHQLERQVSLNTSMARRCASLSAELSIVTGIANALSARGEVGTALEQVLAACFDAGGFALGALHLFDEATPPPMKFGDWGTVSDESIAAYLEGDDVTSRLRDGRAFSCTASSESQPMAALLERANVPTAVVAPVLCQGTAVGALLMGSTEKRTLVESRLPFIEGVATQIGQALALTRAFADQEASEERSREQANVLRSVLESMAEGVVVVDGHGAPQLWNRAAESILGCSLGELLAGEWPAQFKLCSADTLLPIGVEDFPLTRALSGEVVGQVELVVPRSTGMSEGIYISANATPLGELSRISGAVMVFRDVTRERLTQQQLVVSDRMASVGMLAAGVAHEINNPLAAVLANLEVVLGELTASAQSDSLREYIEDAYEGAERIRNIVADLKLFSRSKDENLGAVDVRDVLESALRLAHNEIRHRARVERDYQAIPQALGNHARLGQVFLNLIVNAAQAIPPGNAASNRIHVRTRGTDAGITVEIEDTGTGMSPEALRRAFTPFYTTKPVGEGTGLGLSICHRLITGFGGTIHIDSEQGRGTCIRVDLCSAVEAEPSLSKVPPSLVIESERPKRGRVLVVDDEVAIVRIATRILGRAHECVGVSTAAEALALVRAGERFDVILCDLMMPAMTGMDLYQELASSAPELKDRVVFLTGGAFSRRAREFLEHVQNRCIEKPFDSQGLLRAVSLLFDEASHRTASSSASS